MSEKIYYVPHDMSGNMVLVKEGVEGYWESKVSNEEALAFNEKCGYSPAEIKAAGLASMFGNWAKFEEIKAVFNKKLN